MKANSSYNIVITRKKYIKPKDGVQFHMGAFTTLSPAPQPDNKIFRDKPNIHQVQEIGRRLFNDVVLDKIQAMDALKQWQTEGDAALQQMKDKPGGAVGGMGVAVPMIK